MNEREFKAQLYDKFRQTGIESEIKAKVAEKLVQNFKIAPKIQADKSSK